MEHVSNFLSGFWNILKKTTVFSFIIVYWIVRGLAEGLVGGIEAGIAYWKA